MSKKEKDRPSDGTEFIIIEKGLLGKKSNKEEKGKRT